MGLSYILCKKETSNRVPFLFIPSNARGLYIKIPRDYLPRPDTYISFLISLNYHVMLFSSISKKISNPLSLREIAQRFEGKLLTSKGNRNRYVFSGFYPDKVTWLFDRTLGRSLTKKKASNRLLSYHFLKEQGISEENFRRYIKTGRYDPRRQK